MQTKLLSGRRILLAEDEYSLANELADSFREAGCELVGPTASLKDALQLASSETVDAAVLDINLRGEMVYPAADKLLERNIPVIFATGYDRSEVPERFRNLPRLEKPFDPSKLIKFVVGSFETPKVSPVRLKESRPLEFSEQQVFSDLQVVAAKWRNFVRNPNAMIPALMSLAPRRLSIERNADLAREGEKLRYIYMMVEGVGVRYNGLRDGTRQISAFMLPGDFCDLHGGLLESEITASVRFLI